ncbi:hypothetical protein STEG23_033339 [Scotinomys teguina]
MEKRGPYMVTRAPSIQAKLQKHRDLAKAVLRRKGMLGGLPNRPDSSGKRSVKFNKGYTALSQSPDENLVSLDSDSDGELESRYSSGYSSAEASPERLCVQCQASDSITTTAKCLFVLSEHSTPGLVFRSSFQNDCTREKYGNRKSLARHNSVNQDVSRQLLQDGYHLDEIPDDEDLDLIPPKPIASSTCSCCWCCPGDSSCTLQ